MRKLILAFTALAISAGAYAQGQSTTRTASPHDQHNNQNHHWQNNTVDKLQTDGVMMQNGKIMKVENGQVSVLEDDMNMSNGTRVRSDGSYTTRDGLRKTLKEGEHMDMSGNMFPEEGDTDRMDRDRLDKDKTDKNRKDKDRNMYLVPDSIKNRNF